MANAERTEERLRGNWLYPESAARFRRNFSALRKRLADSGETVAVAESDPVNFLSVFFAAHLAGRPVVLANPAWGRTEWEQTLEATGAKRIRANGEIAAKTAGPISARPTAPGEILIPTGGTTGRVRFARHSWKTLSASADGFARHFGGGPVDSVCVLPLFHVSGLMQVVRAIETGGTVLLADWRQLEAGNIPKAPDRFFLSLVPSQLHRLLRLPALIPWLKTARAIPVGGAAAPAPLVEEAAKLRLPLSLSYGSTETAAMVAAQQVSEFLAGDRSSGRPLPHVSVRIAEGRIFVEGSSLFGGYIPGEPAAPPHWSSGDLGHFDGEGRLHVSGRSDRIIVTGGEKVLPDEIEQLLIASGLVSDVFILGVPDREWGEAVAALYVPKPDVSQQRLRETLQSRIAPHKIPKKWFALAEIPRTPHGKIDRRKVDQRIGGQLPRHQKTDNQQP